MPILCSCSKDQLPLGTPAIAAAAGRNLKPPNPAIVSELETISGGLVSGTFSSTPLPPRAKVGIVVPESMTATVAKLKEDIKGAGAAKLWEELAKVSEDREDRDVRSQLVQAGVVPLIVETLWDVTWTRTEKDKPVVVIPPHGYECMQWAVQCAVHITRSTPFREYARKCGLLNILATRMKEPGVAKTSPALLKSIFLLIINCTHKNKVNQGILQVEQVPRAVAALVDPATGLKRHRSDSAWAMGLRALGCMVTPDMHDEEYLALATPGAYAGILEGVSANLENILQAAACDLVGMIAAKFTPTSPAPKGLVLSSALERLMKLLHPFKGARTVRVLKAALGALVWLTRNDEAARDGIRDIDEGLERLVGLFDEGTDPVCTCRAVWVMSNMCTDNRANQDALRQELVIPRLVGLVEQAGDKALVKAALSALHNLGTKHADNVDMIVSAGAIPVLVHAFHTEDYKLSSVAQIILVMITARGEDNKAAVVEAGGSDVLEQLADEVGLNTSIDGPPLPSGASSPATPGSMKQSFGRDTFPADAE